MTQSSLHDEGVVKYKCTWDKQPAASDWNIAALNTCRTWLFSHKLIGINAAGVGYGNISLRYHGDQFIISGSATGHLAELTEQHYAKVTGFDVKSNHLFCSGPAQASSESMSHGTLYRMSPEIGAVIHIHHEGMWQYFINRVPTTSPEVSYGTPEMALEIEQLYTSSLLPQKKVMVMGGHFEGIVTFGASIEIALAVLREYYDQYQNVRSL